MTNLIKQVLLLIIIACTVALFLSTLGINLILGFVIGVILQYALYNAFVYGVDAYTTLKAKKIEYEKIREISQQGIEVTCPCVNKVKEFIPIKLNRPNYYKCSTCNKTVGAFVGVETAVITEPIAETDLSSIERLIETKLNEHTR